jgi:hypothetical protein
MLSKLVPSQRIFRQVFQRQATRSLLHSPNLSRMSTENSQKTEEKEEKKTGKSNYEQRFGTNRKYEKPAFLQDDYDHLKGKKDMEDSDFLPDYFSKEQPEIKRNPINLNLPWLINGVPEMEIKSRYMGDQIFSRMKVHKAEVLEHLFKIYRAVLLSAADNDYDFIKEY